MANQKTATKVSSFLKSTQTLLSSIFSDQKAFSTLKVYCKPIYVFNKLLSAKFVSAVNMTLKASSVLW